MQQNPLCKFINSKEECAVHMYWPKNNCLLPVEKMYISEIDAKYLIVEYYKPKNVKMQDFIKADIEDRIET